MNVDKRHQTVKVVLAAHADVRGLYCNWNWRLASVNADYCRASDEATALCAADVNLYTVIFDVGQSHGWELIAVFGRDLDPQDAINGPKIPQRLDPAVYWQVLEAVGRLLTDKRSGE